jgi:hypothetical protein
VAGSCELSDGPSGYVKDLQFVDHVSDNQLLKTHCAL